MFDNANEKRAWTDDMLLQLSDETSEFYTDVNVLAWPHIRPEAMLSVVARLCPNHCLLYLAHSLLSFYFFD